jgi:hypothetical protein
MSWEINAVHACGGRIYISTPTESQSVTGTSSTFESNRMALKAWELAGNSGADGVVDNDAMFYQLFGTNYYTNLTYFDGTTHPNAAGYLHVVSNFVGVLGTNYFTPNNVFLQPLYRNLKFVP